MAFCRQKDAGCRTSIPGLRGRPSDSAWLTAKESRPPPTHRPQPATIRHSRTLTNPLIGRSQGAAISRSRNMLQVPLEIAFHNMSSSAWAEQEIRSRVADLERRYDRLVSCRVRIDQRAKDLTGTIPPVVHIELGIPGRKDLVVSHEPDHLQHKFQAPDLHNAINEAFRIAEDQLASFKDKRQRRSKDGYHSDAENQFLGQVAELTPDEDFGFLMTKEGGLLYFHRNSLLSGDFDALERGDALYYVEQMGDTGPIATKVRVKAQ